MHKNLLMLHGNGGASTRFIPFLDLLKNSAAPFKVHIPKLSGFEGRSLPKSDDYWAVFLADLENTIATDAAPWIYYGHGIGGSILLELAARNYTFPSGKQIFPEKVILHSCIGASLQYRFFPKLMKPMPMRKFIKQMVHTKWLQNYWEKKLFLYPEKIPQNIKNQFFKDYKQCQAFTVFFDLITPVWYKSTREKIKEASFYFLWGDKERVVASKYLAYWKSDFPNAHFQTIAGWDHFPMLDSPEQFLEEIKLKVL
ncbi:MAG: alpha/beta hydrolase [Bacteroidota bacterium]